LVAKDASIKDKAKHVLQFWNNFDMKRCHTILEKILSESDLKNTYDFGDYILFYPFAKPKMIFRENEKIPSPVKEANEHFKSSLEISKSELLAPNILRSPVHPIVRRSKRLNPVPLKFE